MGVVHLAAARFRSLEASDNGASPLRYGISPYRLVLDMEKRAATVLTRNRHVDRFVRHNDSDYEELGHLDFDQLAGTGARTMPRSRLRTLRDQIAADGEAVKSYVDRRIAHTDQTRRALTWGTLKTAVADLRERYRDVGIILVGTDNQPEPYIGDDWRAVFRDGLFND